MSAPTYEEILNQLGKTKLLAVSKTKSLQAIEQLYNKGQRDFGENRLQELQDKSQQCQFEDIRWHYIGQIQSKKIKHILSVKNLSAVHSIDSLKTLQQFFKHAKEFQGETLELYIQVNTSGEEQKAGVSEYSQLLELGKYFDSHAPTGFQLTGLMTMGNWRTDDLQADARRCFKQLKQWRDQLAADLCGKTLQLSMGMSQDYEIAVEVGSDIVRLGTILFGAR